MQRLRVAFLGPAASFSHQAAIEYFGRSAQLTPCASFADIFSAVQENDADYAAIPFENSTNGSVVQTLDLLADRQQLYSNVEICGEHYLTVHHCLLARKGTASSAPGSYDFINKLYTHPQAWGQCERLLSKHFKGVEKQDVSSTSKAAEIVSQDETGQSAAIASSFAAEYHGADILEANIEDKDDNTTRFLIVRNIQSERTAGSYPPSLANAGSLEKDKHSSAKRKTLISFTVNHSSPGALADALLVFKTHGQNLTSINTRPSRIKPWHYVFFVECSQTPGAPSDQAVSQLLQDLIKVTESCRNLGTWQEQIS
ncbi:prephenate dehydratase [Paecilomyces lecythidis]|uniref:prephenate dehydratase n=1 Tax=Paecilomyces lecythidis TaxID=3004212 RepID=A0ABR3YED1_9EURO